MQKSEGKRMSSQNDVTLKVGADTGNFLAQMKNAKLAVAAFAAAVGYGIGRAVGAAAELETITTRFETLTGSSIIAENHMKDLVAFGAKTPFEIKGLADASATLQAFGTTTKDTVPTLREIGDVASATGRPIKELALIYGQVDAAGKLTGERLLQLSERGVPILRQLAKHYGVTKGAIREMITAGKVSSETFKEVFATLSEEGGFAFKGMEKQSKTLNGKLSNLDDAFEMLMQTIGKSFLPAAKWAVDVLIDITDAAKDAAKWIDNLGKNMGENLGKAWNWVTGETDRIEKMKKNMGVTDSDLEQLDNNMFAQEQIDANKKLQEQEKDRQDALDAAKAEREKRQKDRRIKEAQDEANRKKRIAEKEQREQNKLHDDMVKKIEKREQKERDARDATLAHFVANSSKQNAIGQASAIAQTIISGEEAAGKAWLFGMKGGPVLAGAMAALSWAFTAKRIASIAGVKLYDGGTVMAGIGRSSYRDSVPATLAVGETVVSKKITDKLARMADTPSLNQFDNRISVQIDGNLIVDDDERMDMLIERINERVEDGNARLVATSTQK